jgi:hypothetical protein
MEATEPFEILDLDSNRPISDTELARCAHLVAELSRAGGPAGAAFGDEAAWTAPDGVTVHGGMSAYTLGRFNPDFVRRLRLHTHIFTAYHLDDILTGSRTPSWTDNMQHAFPGGWPDWSIPAFRRYCRGLPDDLIATAPLVAGEVGYKVDGRCVNRDVVTYQERLLLLHWSGLLDWLRRLERPRILEIGGGYGALALFLTGLLPNAEYVIVDLPSSLMYSGCYLTVAQTSHAVEVAGGRRSDAPRRIELMPNGAAAALLPRRFDLAINTASFAEMPADVVRSYATLIHATLAPNGFLFEQNVSLDMLGRANFCAPETILKEVFPVHEEIAGTYMWGTPRVWSAGR